MSTPTSSATTARRTRLERLALLPLVAAALVVVLANAGVRLAPNAHAASTSAAVTGTVGAIASTATNGCSSAIAISITQGQVATGTNTGACTITFGSSNSSGVTLTAVDSTTGDAFFPAQSTNFANAAASCAAMTGSDRVGYKVGTGGTATVNKCTAEANSGNTQYSPVPIVAETVCTTSASGSQDCPIIVGVTENGSNAPAGSYTGTINFASS